MQEQQSLKWQNGGEMMRAGKGREREGKGKRGQGEKREKR